MKLKVKLTISSGILVVLIGALAACTPFQAANVAAPITQTPVVNPGEISSRSNFQNAATQIAPDFKAVDVITGKTVSLREYSGSKILLNFVNYGCDPSTNQKVGAQLLAIKKLQSQRGDFVPISVFCGCCPLEVLRQFAKDNNLNWPWILDSDYSIATKYSDSINSFGYPTLIFIDKNQLVVEVTGYTDLSILNEKINQIK
jgi:peroxiredoxin